MTYPAPPVPDSLPKSLTLRKKVLEYIDIVLCMAYIMLAATVSVTLEYGPERLHDSKAVELVSGLGLSWTTISILFAANALLLCSRFTRVLGWLLGLVLYGYYLESVFNSVVIKDNSGSAFAIAVALAAVLSQLSGLARSMVASEWRKPGENR